MTLSGSGSALNADGTLKDASEINFYNLAGDESDNPIAEPSSLRCECFQLIIIQNLVDFLVAKRS